MSAPAAAAFDALVLQAAAALRPAARILVLSGAGLSAESGLSTFRGKTGALWRERDPMALATPEAFAADPELVWAFYAERREGAAAALPNAAHLAFGQLARHAIPGAREWIHVTQNVDGLLQAAGVRSVIEFHGSLWRTQCSQDCGYRVEEDRERFCADAPCPRCRARLRPGVVWFGEAIPESALSAAQAAIEAADAVLVVGTSAVVEPAASIARAVAGGGAPLIEINPQASALADQARVCIPYPAARAVPALVQHLGE